jgi:hypothetical protein
MLVGGRSFKCTVGFENNPLVSNLLFGLILALGVIAKPDQVAVVDDFS